MHDNLNPVRIAMWSGPRNISTAMMRSFGNRTDSVVIDEPFYACYLKQTGLEHPMRAEILASQSQDPDDVINDLLAPLAVEKSVFYQKHMTHHLLPAIDRGWLGRCRNCFLIRSPAEVIASYALKRETVTDADIGMQDQAEIFDYVTTVLKQPAIIVDSADILNHPKSMLGKLCAALDIPFSERMLKWPAGARKEDGVWGRHWYHSVESSTGFSPYQSRDIDLPPFLEAMKDRLQPLYDRLYARRLRP